MQISEDVTLFMVPGYGGVLILMNNYSNAQYIINICLFSLVCDDKLLLTKL